LSLRIYTRTGDKGETGLFGGQRVGKDDLRVEAYGTVDELNALLGLAATKSGSEGLGPLIARLQNELFDLGSDLATPQENGETHGKITVPRVTADQVANLETEIDGLEAELSPLRQFILPGGTELAAILHFARTVCRRAERRAVALARSENVNPEAIRYLNRLSDLLFVMARFANAQKNVTDVPWKPSK
jgi:cob(I)alamin adenosyltransferase